VRKDPKVKDLETTRVQSSVPWDGNQGEARSCSMSGRVLRCNSNTQWFGIDTINGLK
jgi:hypothetical protein